MGQNPAPCPARRVQCAGQSGGLLTDPNAAGPFQTSLGFRFQEGFQTAFKNRLETAQMNSIPGVVFNTESGFVRAGTWQRGRS